MRMSPPRPPVHTIIDERVRVLQEGYLSNRSAAVGALARLRRGLGKPAGSVLDILDHTHHPEFVLDPQSDEATPQERAAHLAMTLYALHQQAQTQRMHKAGRRFGQAVRALVAGDLTPQDPVARRFAMIGTADSLDELTHHLRGMIQLLRTKQIPLDYGRLATDLLFWQFPSSAAGVRLRWGRDFHFSKTTNTD
ncbi:CRISPR-associated protein, Cse2 family [Alloactinosynnema sp. L-07]|uniref:type I-E CRISPR-associated protein Cse2/CasB n=1 Tax=Alloactinosynnema sp. L-07 TaxID=1653480 RepID=UPI00065EF060|nr:type I-E CRISPR-associated protein Cse2/CasB [Alloactinosynnema sp. L-07]CRK59252.1 CRISPR-associated protein, Cse2 family [Alloactinosynnema sp. L-07]